MFRVTKLRSYLNFYYLYNIQKDQLYRISGSEFFEWLFGPVKFSGLLSYQSPFAYLVHLVAVNLSDEYTHIHYIFFELSWTSLDTDILL